MNHRLSPITTVVSFTLATGLLMAGLSGQPAHAGTKVITTNYPASYCQLSHPKHISIYGNGGVGNNSTKQQVKLDCGFERKGLSNASSVYMSYQDNSAKDSIFCQVNVVDAFGKVLRHVNLKSKRGKGKDMVGRRFPHEGKLDANLRYAGFCFLPVRENGRNPSVLYGITIYERTTTD